LTSLEELEKKLSSLFEKVADLEADKKVSEKYIQLLETKVLSGPSKDIQGVAPVVLAKKEIALETKRKEDEQKQMDFIKENYDLGEITLLAIKKNLISRQGVDIR